MLELSRPICADDFLLLTARVSVARDEVREITKDKSYETALGLFTAKWTQNLFNEGEETTPRYEEKEFTEEEFDDAWHDALYDIMPIIKHILKLDRKKYADMYSDYISVVESLLFDDSEDSEEAFYTIVDPFDDSCDYEDDADETFYNPYTGADEYE